MPHHEAIQRCSELAALARQDLSCTYLAQHELESVLIALFTIITFIIMGIYSLSEHSASAAHDFKPC